MLLFKPPYYFIVQPLALHFKPKHFSMFMQRVGFRQLVHRFYGVANFSLGHDMVKKKHVPVPPAVVP
jgi:hypothetical protein